VLNHFFEMFVDDATRFLDPTAGSGTSLLTANQLGAKVIQGLELDPETHKRAVEFLSRNSDVVRL
jgi:DNA modification methylase